jgi:hypothetical protein
VRFLGRRRIKIQGVRSSLVLEESWSSVWLGRTCVAGLLRDWRLILALLWRLPLTDAADIDVLGLHGDQRNPA